MTKRKPTIRLRLDLFGSEGNRFLSIKEHMGVKNDTEVVRVLVNRYWREHKEELEPTLQHYNLNEEGCLILDRAFQPPRIIQVFFKPDGTAECELCESQHCRHIQFALSIPAVTDILSKRR